MTKSDPQQSAPTSRRAMLRRAGSLGIGGLAAICALGGTSAHAETSIAADARNKCATCQFWGGARHVSADGANVIADGKGICNNPKSPAYQKQTRPDQGAPTWERWDALG